MESHKTISALFLSFICYLLVGGLIMPPTLIAQNHYLRDSLDAEKIYAKSLTFKASNLLDSSYIYAKESAQLFAKLRLWQKWYDSQYEVYITLYNQDKYEIALKQLQEDTDYTLPLANSPVLNAKIKNWFGYIHLARDEFKKSLIAYLEEVKILEIAKHPKGKHGNFINIAIIYTMQGDYKLALLYLKKAESLFLATNDERSLYNVYYDMGVAYFSTQAFDKAIISYKKCTNIYKDDPDVDIALARVYREKGALKKAMDYIDKAWQVYQDNEWDARELLTLKGSIHLREGKPEIALNLYKTALSLALKTDEVVGRTLGQLYIEVGDIYFGLDSFSLALIHYHKALHELLPVFEEENININPSLATMDMANGVWVMEALIGKGNAFQQQYQQDKDIEHLQKAVNCYELAFESIDLLRQNYTASSSKTGLIAYAHPIYEKALQGTFTLYQITKKETYLDQAFAFFQKTKAFLLTTTLQNVKALNVGGVPDSLIQKEAALKQTAIELNREIAILKAKKGKSTDSTSLANFEEKRFQTQRDLQNLTAKFEQEYPQYPQLKNENKVASIEAISTNVLDHKTALIDFFWGEKSLFILTITKDVVDWQEIKRTEKLDKAIRTFVFEAGNANFSASAKKSYESFTTSAQFVFQKLLQKSLAKIDATITSLIIIPDGILNTLPFEALLTQAPKGAKVNYSFSNLSYLLKDYVISYHYAPQALLAQKRGRQNSKAPKLFAGFAPSFSGNALTEVQDCAGLEFAELKYNTMEVAEIAKHVKGEAFIGNNATVQFFKNNAHQYQILHLATHACMNEEDPLNHKIFFADEAFLSAYELYNLPLEADMVVLSACETGVGKIVKGEGVMSLARGFAYTGCPSILMSLWSVPDKASAEIMIDFYKNLQNNLPKDEALRNAKLAYINNQKRIHHHPSYWAAFVTIGDTKPLSLGTILPNWIWFGGVGFLLLSIFLLVKRTKS